MSRKNRKKTTHKPNNPPPKSGSAETPSQPTTHSSKPSSKPQQKKQEHHHEHGIAMTVVIVMIVLHGLVAAYAYNAYRMDTAYLSKPWVSGLMAVHSLANVIAALGIYWWKKWGLYIYAGSTVLAVVLGLITVGIWSLFYFVLPAVIVGWVLRTKWNYFS
jgi:cation transport ATPase